MSCGGLMGLCDGNKGWRAGTSVQIFVGTANCKIDRMKVECDFDHAYRMTEVPHHQRTGVVKLFGDGGHVEQRACAIINMREHGDRDRLVEQGVDRGAIRTNQSSLHRTTRGLDCAFDDIEVCRERLIL